MDQINSEPMRELLTALASGDRGIFAHPASSPENIEKIRVRCSISEERISGDAVTDLFLCLGCLLAQLFIELYRRKNPRDLPVLRGFVVLFWKFFASPTPLAKYPAILDACRNPDAADKFQHFLSDSLGEGKTPPEDLGQWFISAFGGQSFSAPARLDADRRNLGKHVQKAWEYFAKALYQINPSILLELRPAAMAVGPKEISREAAISLLAQLALQQCAFAPAALGINIPIQSCVGRNVRVGQSVLNTAVDNILATLGGASGTFSSRPFLGTSTLMRILTVNAAEDKTSKTSAGYVQAEAFYRYVLTHRQVYEYLADLMLEAGLIGSELRPSMLSRLQLLDQEGKLIFLVDDLQKL